MIIELCNGTFVKRLSEVQSPSCGPSLSFEQRGLYHLIRVESLFEVKVRSCAGGKRVSLALEYQIQNKIFLAMHAIDWWTLKPGVHLIYFLILKSCDLFMETKLHHHMQENYEANIQYCANRTASISQGSLAQSQECCRHIVKCMIKIIPSNC